MGYNAKSFKAMAENIESLNSRLEDMVKARTRTLENTVRELKEAQNQLVESEKVAALDNLVAGIAHEASKTLNINFVVPQSLVLKII